MNVSAVMTIAYRDLLKFLRDPMRMLGTLIFPVVFVIVLGGSLESNLGEAAGYSFLAFVFTGVFAQTLFQSTSLGIVFLLDDRQNDFMQEIFVAPISRYAILLGKICGETSVALMQGFALLALALIVRVPMDARQALSAIPVGIVCCLFGGAFGVLIVSKLPNQRAAQQIFGFIFLPQFFLSGVISPIKTLPWYLKILSLLTPMRYAVDLGRNVFYWGKPEYDLVVLQPFWVNATVISVCFVVFLSIGTAFFVRSEQNR